MSSQVDWAPNSVVFLSCANLPDEKNQLGPWQENRTLCIWMCSRGILPLHPSAWSTERQWVIIVVIIRLPWQTIGIFASITWYGINRNLTYGWLRLERLVLGLSLLVLLFCPWLSMMHLVLRMEDPMGALSLPQKSTHSVKIAMSVCCLIRGEGGKCMHVYRIMDNSVYSAFVAVVSKRSTVFIIQEFHISGTSTHSLPGVLLSVHCWMFTTNFPFAVYLGLLNNEHLPITSSAQTMLLAIVAFPRRRPVSYITNLVSRLSEPRSPSALCCIFSILEKSTLISCCVYIYWVNGEFAAIWQRLISFSCTACSALFARQILTQGFSNLSTRRPNQQQMTLGRHIWTLSQYELFSWLCVWSDWVKTGVRPQSSTATYLLSFKCNYDSV